MSTTRPSGRGPGWQAGIALAVVALLAGSVVGLLVLNRGEPPTGGLPSLDASPTSTGAATAEPSTSPQATGGEPTAAATATATPLPQAFAQVAAFPGASSNAMVSWPGGWIAVGRADERPSVWLSADGSTWEPHAPTGLDGAVNHVVALPDGRVLAVGFSDDAPLGGDAATWVSSDGLDWQRLDIGIPDLLNAVDVAAGPLGLVMIGRAEPNASGRNEYAWYSADGLSWERVWETQADDSPAAVGAGPEGFVVVGQQGYGQGAAPIGLALASADGREWIEAPTDGALGTAGPTWSVVPMGNDWMATSLQVRDVHGLRSANGLDWTLDPEFPVDEARQGGMAQLTGDSRFALLGSILAEGTELPVLLFAESAGWQETEASTSSSIAAASRDGLTVLMVNAGSREAPELQFWVAATPG